MWNSERVRSMPGRALSMNGSKRACVVPVLSDSDLLKV
jgi:hypothetical protein